MENDTFPLGAATSSCMRVMPYSGQSVSVHTCVWERSILECSDLARVETLSLILYAGVFCPFLPKVW